MIRKLSFLSLLLALPAAARGLTVDDMLAMQRVGAPVVSPDGKQVAFAVRDTKLELNAGRYDVWLAAIDGSSVKRLTSAPENDLDPAWSPDGKSIYFLSTRGGSSQVWRVAAAGGDAEQVTKLPVDVGGFDVFPDGKRLLLAIEVWPEAKTLADSAKRDAAVEKDKVKARSYETLLFRHWDTWEDGRYSHLFVWSPGDVVRDLTPGLQTDTPHKPFGDMMSDVAISPDGKSVVYVRRVGDKTMAWTTNTDVFLVSADGKGKPVNLTEANKAYDFGPTFSPDGKQLGLTMMKRPGFEADRARVAVIDLKTRKLRVVTEAWDRSADDVAWSADGKTIFTSADHLGHHGLFRVDVGSGEVTPLVEKAWNTTPEVAGDRIVFSQDRLDSPAELYTVRPDGSGLTQITKLNDERVKSIAWGAYEQFTFTGAKGDKVHGFVMKPAGWDGKSKKKYPVAFIIHGGPQGSMGNHWHYRWNPQAYAGHGLGVVFIDFHGSSGYGQAFTDAIRGDWGGAPYEDLMAGLDHALAKYPWLDGKRVVALGASYGAFMINWINGKTDRFRALVAHDGNLDERMAYYQTEELFFPEWEHGGPAWENDEGYRKHSPIELVKNWKTPTLVIHGALDYRIPDTQGMATFTALQRKGIPSRFLHFPDENHWVLKPLNSKRWHEEVLAWIDRWTK